MRTRSTSAEQRTEAIDPPGVAGLTKCVPAIVRVPPELTGGAEIIRRHAGQLGGLAIGVELEQFPSRPHVRTVVRDEDRQVPDDFDRTRVTLLAHAPPVIEEEKLCQLVRANLSLAPLRPCRDRGRFAPGDVRRPCRPRPLVVRVLDGHEQRVIVQPVRVCGAETVEPVARRARSRRLEPLEHARPEGVAMRNHRREVDSR